MKTIYLLLAVIGAVVPMVFFQQYFAASGFGLGDFVRAVFANGAAGGLASDLLIASPVFWLWMTQQRRAGRGPHPVPFVLLNLFIGLSCALPAWLYVLERGRARPTTG